MKKAILSTLLSGFTAAHAAELWVAPTGSPGGAGTQASPLDLATAISSGSRARAGDTVWLRGGTYGGAFTARIGGSAGNPITFRAAPGERVIIDGAPSGGTTLYINAPWTVWRDFEVTESTPSRPINQQRDTGIDVVSAGVKLINLVVHDTGVGIGFWTAAVDAEIYGCLIYNVGWRISGNAAGHSIYTQNDTGTKWIHDNIFGNSFCFGLHAYTEGGQIRGYDLQGNIAFNAGAAASAGHRYSNILIGGKPPSSRLNIVSNYTYHSPFQDSTGVRLSYGQLNNGDMVCRNNVFVSGDIVFQAKYWHQMNFTGNTIVSLPSQEAIVAGPFNVMTNSSWNNNTYYGVSSASFTAHDGRRMDFNAWKSYSGADSASTATGGNPTGVSVFVRPNRYEPKRANIVVYNWDQLNNVAVDVSRVLAAGDTFELRNAQDFLARPVLSGTYAGGALTVPMTNLSIAIPTGDTALTAIPEKRFNTFILIGRGSGNPPPPNTAPTLASIADQATNEDTARTVNLTVGDAETAPGSLAVTAASSNSSLVPIGNLALGGSGANRTLTLTPVANQSGSATITVTVSDGALSASRTFTFAVNPVNDLPTLSAISNQSTTEQTPVTASFTVGDVETAAGALVVTAASSNPTLIPNAALVPGGSGANRTLTLTPASAQSGSATITVSVSDGSANTNRAFTLNVAANNPPTLSTLNLASSSEDVPVTIFFAVGDAETAAASLAVSASAANTTLLPPGSLVLGGSGADRTLTLIPATNQTGSSTVTLSVNDGRTTTTGSFTLTINPVNDLPTISPIANQSTAPQTPVTVNFTVGDVETAAGSLVVTASSANQTLVPNSALVPGGSGSSRSLTITPAAGQTGSAAITVAVSDGTTSATSTFTLSVQGNSAPTLSVIDPVSLAEDATATVGFTVGDTETAAASLTVTVSASNPTLFPAGRVVLGGSGADRTLTFRPATNRNGAASVTLSVSDGQATTTREFNVTVNPVNDLPSVSWIANQTNLSTVPAVVAFTVSDLETPAADLVVTATSSKPSLLPAGSLVVGGSGANRTLTLSAANGQVGAATVSITVNDGAGTFTRNFPMIFTNIVTGPRLAPIANQSVEEDVLARIPLTILDAGANPAALLVRASSSNPTLFPATNVTVTGTGSTRELALRPAAGLSGVSTVVVTLTGDSVTSSQSFQMTVTAVNDLPTISAIANQSTSVSAGVAVNFTVGDAETAAGSLAVTATSDNPTLAPNSGLVLGGSGASRTLTITPAFGQTGSASITVTVDDGAASASRTFALSVFNNSAPTISLLNPISINEDTPVSITFSAEDAETPADQLIVSVVASNTALFPAGRIVLGGSGADRTATFRPATNQTGVSIVNISVSDGISTTTRTLTITVNPVNDLPFVSWLANQTNSAAASHLVAFTISDPETPAENLEVTVLTSKPALVPLENCVLGGSGANRTLTVSSLGGQAGGVTLSIRVSDGTNSFTRNFPMIFTNAPSGLAPASLSDLAAADGEGSAAQAKGVFHGLFYESTGVEVASAGGVTLTLTEEGAFTGVLQLGRERYALTGRFDGGSVVTTAASEAGAELGVRLQLISNHGGAQIVGRVSAGDWTAELYADRAAAAATPASYVIEIAGAGDGVSAPSESSVGVVAIDAAGGIQFLARLADDTAVAQRGQVLESGAWALFAPLYGGRGSLTGWIELPVSDGGLLNGKVSWIRPALPEANAFPAGFELETTLTGTPAGR